MELSDWLDADVDIARKRFPVEQLGDAFSWTSNVMRFARKEGYETIYLTGHSLGGALVQVVAANLSGLIGVTYNAPGMKSAKGQLVFEHKYDHIVNVRLDWDPISAFGEHLGKIPIVLQNGSISPANHKIDRLLEALLKSPVGKWQPEDYV